MSNFQLVDMTGPTVSSPEGPFLQTTIYGQNVCYGYDDRDAVLKKVRVDYGRWENIVTPLR